MSEVACEQCNSPLTPEDAVYDDNTYRYYCDMECFYDWADDNVEDVIEYYERMNVHE